MARIRTIKPSFFTSLTIADLTPEQRLTFIGLWTEADDEGRLEYDRRLVKAALWPLDDRSLDDVEADVRALTESSLITHYIVNRRRYLSVNGWSEHQRINRPTKSKLPDPSEGEITALTCSDEPSPQTHAQLTEDSPWERKGREGKGREGSSEPKGSGRAKAQPATEPENPTAQTVIAEWIDRQKVRPAGRHIGHVSKVIKELLSEGFTPEHVHAGLTAMDLKNLSPSNLPTLVTGAANGNGPRSGTNQAPRPRKTSTGRPIPSGGF